MGRAFDQACNHHSLADRQHTAPNTCTRVPMKKRIHQAMNYRIASLNIRAYGIGIRNWPTLHVGHFYRPRSIKSHAVKIPSMMPTGNEANGNEACIH
eukprot:1158067-Pelagomonas_calceolata.AAC.14